MNTKAKINQLLQIFIIVAINTNFNIKILIKTKYITAVL